MGRELKCINGCKVTAIEPRFYFAGKTFKGSNIMCWSCFVKDMRVVMGIDMLQWLTEYIATHTDPMTLAKQRIAELEARLAQANKVVEDQRRILKLQETL